MPEYFYGEMVPSTGYVPVFDLRLLLPGLALLLPDRADPSRASRLVELPKLMRTFAESARWNEILGMLQRGRSQRNDRKAHAARIHPRQRGIARAFPWSNIAQTIPRQRRAA